jgi:hypothetical protein
VRVEQTFTHKRFCHCTVYMLSLVFMRCKRIIYQLCSFLLTFTIKYDMKIIFRILFQSSTTIVHRLTCTFMTNMHYMQRKCRICLFFSCQKQSCLKHEQDSTRWMNRNSEQLDIVQQALSEGLCSMSMLDIYWYILNKHRQQYVGMMSIS